MELCSIIIFENSSSKSVEINFSSQVGLQLTKKLSFKSVLTLLHFKV